MKTIKINSLLEIPENYTGIAESSNGNKWWFKEGKYHREDGPAVEYPNGTKCWYKNGKLHREDGPAYDSPTGYKESWIEGKQYHPINLKDYVILDFYQGRYNLIWYKLLDKNRVFEYPDIPGLIEK
jgi:hypothetical protein